MKKLAFLEFAFIFGEDTFDNVYDFEKLLSQVFKVKGYEAQVLDVRGYSGRKVIYITPITDKLGKPMPKVKDFKSEKKVNL